MVLKAGFYYILLVYSNLSAADYLDLFPFFHTLSIFTHTATAMFRLVDHVVSQHGDKIEVKSEIQTSSR